MLFDVLESRMLYLVGGVLVLPFFLLRYLIWRWVIKIPRVCFCLGALLCAHTLRCVLALFVALDDVLLR